jgi:hypothetical protein
VPDETEPTVPRPRSRVIIQGEFYARKPETAEPVVSWETVGGTAASMGEGHAYGAGAPWPDEEPPPGEEAPPSCPFPRCGEPELHQGHSIADWAAALSAALNSLSAARGAVAELREAVAERDGELAALRGAGS